jgi:GT2 family glycosyltransferase
VGLLDTDFFMYAEEMEWCYRLKRAGWTVHYLPEARAIHWAGGSAKRIPERRRAQLYRSKWLYMRKHRGVVRATIFRVIVQAVAAGKLVLWKILELTSRAEKREAARQHVASYRILLLDTSPLSNR